MKIKTLTLTALLASAFMACTNMEDDMITENEGYLIDETVETIPVADAQRQFAIILSKAVYDNPSLRQFIKDEALKQFDNDHDVFYPFVRDSKVDGDRTFRDILLQYTTEGELKSIEASLPLLNILVPDLGFVQAFSVNKWDTSDEETAVAYDRGDNEGVFYIDGDSIFSMSDGGFPAFPYLVVKNSERMKVVGAATRADGSNALTYDFIDEAFDGSKRTAPVATRGDSDGYYYYDITDAEPYFTAEELGQDIIEAYQIYKDSTHLYPNVYPRDHIYYDMFGKKGHKGIINKNIREELYKFTVPTGKYENLSDAEGDPKYQGETWQKKNPISKEDIVKRIWTDGNYEFVFHVNRGEAGISNAEEEKLVIDVPPYSLYGFKKLRWHRRSSTGLRHSKYLYYATPSDMVSLWVDVKTYNKNTRLYLSGNDWDLTRYSSNINISVEEFDSPVEKTREYSNSNSFAVKGDFNWGISEAIKVVLGISNTTTAGNKTSIKTVEKSDDLGSIDINYCDPIIISDSEKNTKGYKIYTPSTASVLMVILPRNMYY